MRRALARAGFELRRKRPPARVEGAYMDGEGIRLDHARYCPWLVDEPFRLVYRDVVGNTTVDEYRCYELWQMVQEAAKLDRGDILEVGVWRGGSGALLAASRDTAALQSHVFLCDTFAGVVKSGENDPKYADGEFANTSKSLVESLLGRLELSDVTLLEGIFPDQTSAQIDDKNFRFCHIDVDAYQSAKDVAEWVWPRLVVGGIIVYDDYGFADERGVTQYVEEQRPERDRVVVHNLNGHAIVVKVR